MNYKNNKNNKKKIIEELLHESDMEMTDEELLQLVRDFTEENGREPMQADVLYDRELKQRFGPWNRMLEQAGTRPVAQSYLDKKRRRKEKQQKGRT